MTWKNGFVIGAIALIIFPQIASAQAERFAVQNDLDHVWTVTAAALVFFMQAGFLLLEAGSVRSKNSVNVAQKNLMDFVLSTILFGAVGYTLMFGASQYGLFGWDSGLVFFGSAGDWSMTFFIFQLMFCGTAATIVSGAVAERMAINGYLACTVIIAMLIYPVAGHWIWGGLLNGSDTPWLASMGFMDFAGSTVVHSVGAWVALAAIIIIGPRLGKFDASGNPVRLRGHSPVLATVGAVILWVGWLGFNGGSMLTGTGGFANVILNTVVAGAAGGFGMMIIGRVADGLFRPEASINGILGGLVAITASADVMTSQAAFAIGLGASVVVYFSTRVLEEFLKLDDPLGAIAVHGCAGLYGTLVLPFAAPLETLLAGDRVSQFVVQLTGVSVVFVWAFGVAWVALKGIDYGLKMLPGDDGSGLRVPELHEREGLNQHEHDAPMGSGILQQIMAEVALNPQDGLQKITIDFGDEAYETGEIFNKIIDNIIAERQAEEDTYQTNKAKRMAVEAEISSVMQACAAGDFGQRLETKGKAGFLLELCRGVNGLCDSAETALSKIGASLEAVSRGDLSQKMDGRYSGTLSNIQASLNDALFALGSVAEDLGATVSAASVGDFSKEIDLNGKQGFFKDLSEKINLLCAISEDGLSDLHSVLVDVGDGKLDSRMSPDHQGRFADLSRAVNEMTDGISHLIRNVLSTAGSVSDAGGKISERNAAIAKGSQMQVSSLNETSELLVNLEQHANQAAKDAEIANENCKAASCQAEEGKSRAERARLQMAQIEAATNDISNAIKLIESIATQTTMLSLNASVEAVRAVSPDSSTGGNEGFKVVAQEVRSLATATAEAAARVREKTETVRNAVAEGVELVDSACGSMDEIHVSMGRSTDSVRRLYEAGKLQLCTISQVKDQSEVVSHKAIANLEEVNMTLELSQTLDSEAARTMAYLQEFEGVGPTLRNAA